uniref:Uncharacterized protein n=1 Tax=Cacopsylla melanoneura TaxID=428564 RepID=A0A8D8LVV6_9HEMI
MVLVWNRSTTILNTTNIVLVVLLPLCFLLFSLGPLLNNISTEEISPLAFEQVTHFLFSHLVEVQTIRRIIRSAQDRLGVEHSHILGSEKIRDLLVNVRDV